MQGVVDRQVKGGWRSSSPFRHGPRQIRPTMLESFSSTLYNHGTATIPETGGFLDRHRRSACGGIVLRQHLANSG